MTKHNDSISTITTNPESPTAKKPRYVLADGQ